MGTNITIRLSFMMFLQFFIWSTWFVTLGTFLGNNLNASDGQIGIAFSTQSWGAIIAPFIIGLIADRYFNAERILGVIHVVGGIMMVLLYNSTEFKDFYIYLLIYMILYMPTLALVNSVTFRQMDNPAKQFARIRVFGTVGWIVAGLVISYVFSWDSKEMISEGALKNTFLMSAGGSFLLGFYSFSLPKTPPILSKEKASLGTLMGLDALKLLKDRNYRLFFISSILICIPLAFYYQNTNPFLTEIGVENSTGKMTIGQISEVLFMLLLPVFLIKIGFKKTLIVAILAWALRYVLFAFGNADSGMVMIMIGIALHGICYDFFFVSGQIYTDEHAGEKYKSSAQGLITLATYGVGMLIGFWIAGKIGAMYVTDSGHDWQTIWLYPAAFAFVVFIFFTFAFKENKKSSH